MAGRIELIEGPMYAGKSTELMRRMWRYRIHQRCVLVKPALDTRYDTLRVSTHDKISADARTLEKLADALAWAGEFDVLLVDEGQFFPDLANAAGALADEGKIVVVAALSGDFRRMPFEQVGLLGALADTKQMLAAVCACGRDAPFSKRIGAREGDAVVKIGGAETYVACCRVCWNK